MNRTDWLVVLLFGILLLVIAIPAGSTSQSNGVGTGTDRDTEVAASDSSAATAQEDGNSVSKDALMTEYKNRLETELAALLSRMDGVGEVEVMLTLKDSGAHVLDKNVKRDGDSSETDTVVYSNENGEEPYVTNQFTPEVEGVLIVAEGGGNAVIVSDISDAVMALFGIEAHKIKIVKMSD
jgi:stage III sporulation protein AG